VAENHASVTLTEVSPKHKHDLSVIVAAPTAALPPPRAAWSPPTLPVATLSPQLGQQVSGIKIPEVPNSG
jgi:hypothetical protein